MQEYSIGHSSGGRGSRRAAFGNWTGLSIDRPPAGFTNRCDHRAGVWSKSKDAVRPAAAQEDLRPP